VQAAVTERTSPEARQQVFPNRQLERIGGEIGTEIRSFGELPHHRRQSCKFVSAEVNRSELGFQVVSVTDRVHKRQETGVARPVIHDLWRIETSAEHQHIGLNTESFDDLRRDK
jgi:hypothetical protein